MSPLFERRVSHYALAVTGVVGTTWTLAQFQSHTGPLTAASILLLIILFAAIAGGSEIAIAASLAGIICFNSLFPFASESAASTHMDRWPTPSFAWLADPPTRYSSHWLISIVFLVVAVTVGRLSSYARRCAARATESELEAQRLRRELEATFERVESVKALRQSERLKSALLDAVAHDVYSPLTSIKASVTTLLDEERARTLEGEPVVLNGRERREMLEIINEECDRLNSFVESLFEVARLEADQVGRGGETLERIIHNALDRAKTAIRQHEVRVEIEQDLPTVSAAHQSIAEVIYTLLDNAAKYSPPRTKILITARRASSRLVRVAVEDEGPGIPIGLRKRVFDRFFRAINNGEGRRASTGKGIGLTIAREIVEAYGGQIWIESGTGGHGTRVVFTVPIEERRWKEDRAFSS